jgi:hypothetical protein
MSRVTENGTSSVEQVANYTCIQGPKNVNNTSTQQDDVVIPMPQAHRAYVASSVQTRSVNSTQQ